MKPINRFLSFLAPGFALRREIAQRRLERLDIDNTHRRSFDAVTGGRMRADFLHPKNSADAALSDTESLRYHIRQLEYNNGFVAGPIRRIANNVVGQGIRFQSRLSGDDDNSQFPRITQDQADQFNRRAEKFFGLWAKYADKRLISTLSEIQWQASAALERDGACLLVMRTSDRPARLIPTCLELLEIDRLQTPQDESRNPRVRNGIRYDEEGVPEAYYVLKEHPGAALAVTVIGRNSDFEEIPAWNPNGTRKVLHLFNPIRPEQSIGYSALAAGLKDFQDLDRYREAEIYARLEDACLTGFVKTAQPSAFQQNWATGTTGELDDAGVERATHEFAPGQWNYLSPGEDIIIHEPKRQNQSLDVFVNHLLRGPANAMDIPVEVLSQNWGDMNYSQARTVLLQFYLSCRIRQKYLVDHLCVPIWENVLNEFVLRGILQAPGYDRRKDDYMHHGWILPGWSWVDPVKEAQGKVIEVNNGFETLSQVCAGKGYDFEETVEARARELAYIKKLEEKYGITFKLGDEDKLDQEEDPAKEDDPSRSIRRVK